MRSLIQRTWDLPGSFFSDLSDLWPHVETHRANGNLMVRCDLPGVEPKDVEVSLHGDTLTISGERRAEKREGDHYSEVRYGRFERALRIPDGLDPENVTARYTNGVLEVTVPLPKEAAVRKIPVQTEPAGPDSKKAA